MPNPVSVRVQFPIGGLDRRRAYSDQEPGFTPDCLNVMPEETDEKRLRGGSRPGLVPAFNGSFMGQLNHVVQMFEPMVVRPSGKYEEWEDTFDGQQLGQAWRRIIGATGDVIGDLPALKDGYAFCKGDTNTFFGAARTPLPMDHLRSFSLTIYVSTEPLEHDPTGKYEIYLCMDDQAPQPRTGGLALKFNMSISGEVITIGGPAGTNQPGVYLNNTLRTALTQLTLQAGRYPLEFPVTFAVENDLWFATIGDQTFQEANALTFVGATKRSVGFAIEGTVANSDVRILRTLARYYGKTGTASRDIIVAGSHGATYRSSAAGWVAVTNNGLGVGIAPSTDRVHAKPRLDKLFIADRKPVILQADIGRITDSVSSSNILNLIDDSQNFSAAGIDSTKHVVYIDNVQGPHVAGVGLILDFSGNTLRIKNFKTLHGEIGLSGTSLVRYRIAEPPKYYDGSTDELHNWIAHANKGTVPLNCQFIDVFRDRLVLAGDEYNFWYMSRAGDPFDWDYGADPDDGTRAIAAPNSDAGALPEPLTGMLSHGDDYMIFWNARQTWLMRGDPAQGGILDNVSRVVGCVGDKAFARGPAGNVYWLAHDGLYVYDGAVRALSRNRLPNDLIDADASFNHISMVYDARRQGFWLWVTRRDAPAPATTSYWYDLATGGFWPVRLSDLNSGLEIRAMASFQEASNQQSDIYVACKDARARKFSQSAVHDDSNVFGSYIVLGPVNMAPQGGDGILVDLDGTLGAESAGVNWDLRFGVSAEQAYKAALAETGQWTPGLNYTIRPNRRGPWFTLSLNGLPGQPWQFEKLDARIQPIPLLKRL